jgi:hypothetical protein
MTYQVLDDEEWEWEYCDDLEEDDDDPEIACVDCGAPGSDYCQCCGGCLCHRHSETGCGFCKNCPTQEWIDEQSGMPARPPVIVRGDDDDSIPF